MTTKQYKSEKLAYSIQQACEATSLGRTRLYALIKEGRLVARRIGGRTVIPAASLYRLIDVNTDDQS